MNPQVAAGGWVNPGLTLSSDPHLLQACQAGDEAAWQQLLTSYVRLVYAVPRSYGLPRDEAVDITQIVFTALLQSLASWRNDSNLANWLTLVARRHSWRALRSRQRTSEATLPADNLTAHLPTLRPTNELALAAPPPAVQELLLQRFMDYVQGQQLPGHFQRHQATLVLDSQRQPLPAGLRAGASDLLRHYVYAIDLIDVTLNMQPGWRGIRLDLIGQILPNRTALTGAGFIVQLVQHGQEVAITQADTIGDFWFQALDPGLYQLLLSTATLELELPSFTLAS